jgi:hypothetical protein
MMVQLINQNAADALLSKFYCLIMAFGVRVMSSALTGFERSKLYKNQCISI